jgi:hypothetical protein
MRRENTIPRCRAQLVSSLARDMAGMAIRLPVDVALRMTRAREYRPATGGSDLSSSKIHRIDALNVASRSPKTTRGRTSNTGPSSWSRFQGCTSGGRRAPAA